MLRTVEIAGALDLERLYVGRCGADGCGVWVVSQDCVAPLEPAGGCPSPSFGWGREGVAARELAWSLLFDASSEAHLADDWCGEFGAVVVAHLPSGAFSLGASAIHAWLDA